MAVEEVRIMEERCDRCRSLLTTKRVVGQKERVTEHATSNGPFHVSNGNNSLINYNKICRHCQSHLMTLVKKMGVVDRTKGGRGKTKRSRGKGSQK